MVVATRLYVPKASSENLKYKTVKRNFAKTEIPRRPSKPNFDI